MSTNPIAIFVCGIYEEGCLGINKNLFNQHKLNKNTSLICNDQLPFKEKIKQIFCGDYCTFFLLENGQVYACGSSTPENNELGFKVDSEIHLNYGKSIESFKSSVRDPYLVDLNEKVIKIGANSRQNWFLTESRNLYVAGAIGKFKLDMFYNTTGVLKKVNLKSFLKNEDERVTDVTCSNFVAIFTENEIFGTSSVYITKSPLENKGNTDFPQLSLSFPYKIRKVISGLTSSSNFAILFEHPLDFGLIYDGSRIYILKNVKDIGVGYSHFLILLKSKSQSKKLELVGFGTNMDGQISMNSQRSHIGTESSKPIAKSQDIEMKSFVEQITLCNHFRSDQLFYFDSPVNDLEKTNFDSKLIDSIEELECGSWHSGFVTNSGEVVLFGFNENFQLGMEGAKLKTFNTVKPYREDWLQSGGITVKLSCGTRHSIIYCVTEFDLSQHFIFMPKILNNSGELLGDLSFNFN
ncbi:hypothetical protein ABK040_013831 [Willaertia magna]